jgi:hypothetical protein
MFTRSGIRRGTALRWLALIGTSLATSVCGGGGTDEGCTVSSVTIQPSQVTLTLGTSTTLTASVTSSNCGSPPLVSWISSDPAVVSIVANGNQAQITGAALTQVVGRLARLQAPVTISAGAGRPIRTGTSQVTVVPPPEISLSTSALTFNASQGGTNPASQAVIITNSGGGTLGGLGIGTITYGAGATGWLQTPTLNSTTANPSATLTLQPVTSGLAVGTYTATVPVTSGVASNSPQDVTVTFTVTTPPAISLSSTTLDFSATAGGPNPAGQTVTITNSGGGTLSGLAVGTVTYGAGASGWLGLPVLNSSTANPSATLTVQASTGALGAGTYTATIPVLSSVASNSPQNVTVTFTVAPPPPLISPSANVVSFETTAGGPDPASLGITISNSGGGTLTGLAVGAITYDATATGWLQTPTLGSTTADPSTTLTFQAVTGTLTPGVHTATVEVTSPVAANSPALITVMFTVLSTVPEIVLSPASLNYTAFVGGANPAAQEVTITNGAVGTLSGLAVGTITYGAGATGWLQPPTLSSTTASPSATLTIQPVTGALAAGTYTATVPVTSGVAWNSPQNVTVSFTVASSGSVAVFVGNGQTGLVGYALNFRPAVQVTALGVPVPGLSVTFSVASGGGSVTGATVNTDANGVAQVGSWILGAAPGPNTLTATVAASGIAGNPVTFVATGVTQQFNIVVRNIGAAFPANVQAAFDSAETYWEHILYNDLSDFTINTANACGLGIPINETIDDVLILAAFDSIDGPGKILGQAGWCSARGSNALPIYGGMVFDRADSTLLFGGGTLTSVIIHEMGHVLGFDDLTWSLTRNCFQLPTTGTPPNVVSLDTHFDCLNFGGTNFARAMFDSIGGTSYTGGLKVPLENCASGVPATCGPGNYNAHWREAVFGRELMTPYISVGFPNPLSAVTIAMFQDLGYSANYAAAEAYAQVFSLRALAAGQGPVLDLGNDQLPGPRTLLEERTGRVLRVIRR